MFRLLADGQETARTYLGFAVDATEGRINSVGFLALDLTREGWRFQNTATPIQDTS
jgi:hypothetical protein